MSNRQPHAQAARSKAAFEAKNAFDVAGGQKNDQGAAGGQKSDEIEKHHRLPSVKEITGMSTSQIYVLMDRGEFPRPKRMSERIVAWPESKLKEWLESRQAA